MPREPVHGRVCFSQLGQRLFDLLCRSIRALDVVDHLMPQYRKLCGAMHIAVSLSFEVEGREHHGSTISRVGSIDAGEIDLRQPRPSLDHAPPGGPNPAAESDVDPDSAVLVQHPFCTFKDELRPVNAEPGLGQFEDQKIGRCPASVGFQGVHHEVLTHGGAVRSLMSGETGAT